MAKLFVSETGARVVIASADHCPPHVHALHKEERWVVRLWFSYGSQAVGVLSIAPNEGAVRQRQLNAMMAEVGGNLSGCRRLWWDGKRTTCLENKWMTLPSPGQISVLDEQGPGAKQVRSAEYDAGTRVTRMTFQDGSEHRIESGDEA